MKKRIGILGGISPASTLEYYRSLIYLYHERMHDLDYPEIIIYSLDFGRFTRLENEGRKKELAAYISDGIGKLASAGADFAIMAANSAHAAYDEISAQSRIPMLSIVDAAAQEASRLGLKKVLLTGIKYTMKSDFYHKGMNARSIEVTVPNLADQEEINRIIFEELALEKFLPQSRRWFIGMASRYEADGVVLGCTELPLLVGGDVLGKPLLDTLHLHVKAALDYSLS